MSTRITLPRPFQQVTLPGGGSVHVRSLSLRELRCVDKIAEEVPDGPERALRMMELMTAAAVATEKGEALYPRALDVVHNDHVEAVDYVADLTGSQIRAIVEAIGNKEQAKNA